MSQHGCPERLSNRSKGFQEDGASQPTMEVLVETLTGTAFEMTVSPTDTIFAIKSKIFRVEGIPVSQQHLLYNLKELEDSSSLSEHAIGDGARLRLVLGMRGGPISTRRLPPPAPASTEPWPDIERLLDSNRDDIEWTSSGCKVTVLVFRDGERVNMLRVRENHDGSYSPVDTAKYSATLSHLSEGSAGEPPGGALQENAVTMGKMLDLRRRMESLSLQRAASEPHRTGEKAEIQKTRSEETLPTPRLLEGAEPYRQYAPYSEPEDSFAPLYDSNYTRYSYSCAGPRYTLLPPRGTRADPDPDPTTQGGRSAEAAAILEEVLAGEECLRRDSPPLHPVPARDYGPLVGGMSWRGAHSASALQLRAARGARGGAAAAAPAPAPPARAPLQDALYCASTSDLESLTRTSRILPALSRARPREHLHLSDEGLHLRREPPAPAPAPAPAAPQRRARRPLAPTLASTPDPPAPTPAPAPALDVKEKKIRIRCGLCRKRLSIATVHRCRCGAAYCAAHRYSEVHGCAYDYKAAPPPPPPPPRHPPSLPRI